MFNFNTPFNNLTPQQAYDSDDLVIIDVREPDELVGPLGKIAGVHNVPLGKLAAGASLPVDDLDAPVAIICLSGGRSMQGAAVLAQRGYKNVFNITGGMGAWNAKGLPTERPAGATRGQAGMFGSMFGLAS